MSPDITEATKRDIAARFKNTELGLIRIARNLGLQHLSDADIIVHCRKAILSTPLENIDVRGKNYYFYSVDYAATLTINRSSLGIITAKPYPAVADASHPPI